MQLVIHSLTSHSVPSEGVKVEGAELHVPHLGAVEVAAVVPWYHLEVYDHLIKGSFTILQTTLINAHPIPSTCWQLIFSN